MRRLKVIFDTNMRTAHAAGHWAAIQRTKQAFPYLQYIQIQRPTKRHDHARFHDRIWRVDDPIWLKIYPPNGFFCGCIVIQRSEGWMRRNNRRVDDPIELEEEEWIHDRSGEVHMIPRGIHPGFDTNPGAVWLDIRDGWAQMTPDLTEAQRASQLGLIEGLRLRRLTDGRETLIITDEDSVPKVYRPASAGTPDRVSLDGLIIPHRPHFLHSHLTESTLSIADTDVLFNSAAVSITAISPGGSIWRAVRSPGLLPRQAAGDFARHNHAFRSQIQPGSPEAVIYAHARLLYLEKEGLITYTMHLSEQSRQFINRYSDLIQRLTDVRPAP